MKQVFCGFFFLQGLKQGWGLAARRWATGGREGAGLGGNYAGASRWSGSLQGPHLWGRLGGKLPKESSGRGQVPSHLSLPENS